MAHAPVDSTMRFAGPARDQRAHGQMIADSSHCSISSNRSIMLPGGVLPRASGPSNEIELSGGGTSPRPIRCEITIAAIAIGPRHIAPHYGDEIRPETRHAACVVLFTLQFLCVSLRFAQESVERAEPATRSAGLQAHDPFMQLTIRRLKRKQKQYLTARKNAGISNNGLNATDRPRKPIGHSDLR